MEKSPPTLIAGHGTCDNCQYCGVRTGPSNQLQLVCRFNPPTASAALMMTQGGPSWSIVGVFAPVEKGDWCSNFDAKLH